jgi:UDP-N-acetylmuramate-alanine ligase
MKHPDARFVPDLQEAARYLASHLDADSVLVVLSAGDADRISVDVLKALAV